MSTYTPEKLLSLWARKKVDEKMVIGHILQHLTKQQKAQAATNLTVYRFQGKLDTLKAELATLKKAVDHLTALIERFFPNQSTGSKDQSS